MTVRVVPFAASLVALACLGACGGATAAGEAPRHQHNADSAAPAAVAEGSSTDSVEPSGGFAAPAPAAELVARPMSALAPVPFAAEVLRSEIVDGEVYVFDIVAGEVPGTMSYSFANPTETGVGYTRTTVSGQSEPVTESREATWAELEEHAHFPAAVTTWSRAAREVAGQEHAGTLYVSTQPDGSVMQAFFADELPGPPVILELWAGEQVVYSMRLREHTEP